MSASIFASASGKMLALRLVRQVAFPAKLGRLSATGMVSHSAVIRTARSFSSSPAVFLKRGAITTKKKIKTQDARKLKTAKAKAQAAKMKRASSKKPIKKLKEKREKKAKAKPIPSKLSREERARLRERIKKREAIQHRKDLKANSLVKEEPRRGISSFIIFSMERAPALRAKGTPFMEVGKVIGQEWTALSAAEKQNYLQRGEANHVEFQKKYAAWIKSYSPAQIRRANLARRALDRQGLVTRPPIKDDRFPASKMAPYTAFIKDYMREHRGDKDARESFREAAIKWKQLTAEDKKPFEAEARKDKARYDDEFSLIFG